MLAELRELRHIVDELNSTNSINDKKVILAKHKGNDFLKQVLFYTYNPFFQYYVTPATLEKRYNDDLGKSTVHYSSLFALLDDLRHRKITGHAAIQAVNDFAYEFESYKDLIYKVIGKDLEIRMGDSLINKVIPDLIPTFDCALATNFEDVDVDFTTSHWVASRKLDGCRCLVIVDDFGSVSSWSRQGNQFETIAKVEEAIKKMCLKSVVFDGEICLVDDNGNEDFQGIMKQIRKKDHQIANPKYLIFDMLSLREFNAKKGTTLYMDRYHALLEIGMPMDPAYLEVVKQKYIAHNDEYSTMMMAADSNGWEGLILRKNVGYEGKRSKNMVKCKSFLDAEYTVVRAEFGPFRMIENGKEVTKDVLTNVIIMHKGNEVSVGSGFTIEEREYYKQHPNEIVGSVITVKYFQESKNQDGKYSLRFPTVKVIHGNSRTV
jgi:DNA ligase-1